MTVTIAELLKDSAYKLSQFKPEQIKALESTISLKETAKKPAPYITCLVRGKPIKLTPEEAIRQLYTPNGRFFGFTVGENIVKKSLRLTY